MTNGYYVYGLTRAGEGPRPRTHRSRSTRPAGPGVHACASTRWPRWSASSSYPPATGGPPGSGSLRCWPNMRPYHDGPVRGDEGDDDRPDEVRPRRRRATEAIEKAVLERIGTRIEELLDRIDGRVQMGLQVKWGVDNVFAHFVEMDPELRELRDRGLRSHRTAPIVRGPVRARQDVRRAHGRAPRRAGATHRGESAGPAVASTGSSRRGARRPWPSLAPSWSIAAGVAAFTRAAPAGRRRSSPTTYVFACRGPLGPLRLPRPARVGASPWTRAKRTGRCRSSARA